MPFLEHLIAELQKLVERRANIRLSGDVYDEIVESANEAAGDDSDGDGDV